MIMAQPGLKLVLYHVLIRLILQWCMSGITLFLQWLIVISTGQQTVATHGLTWVNPSRIMHT